MATTEELLAMDDSIRSRAVLQRALRKIKPLSGWPTEETIPLECLEQVLHKVIQRYAVRPQFVMFRESADGRPLYVCGIKTDVGTHTWLGDVSGRTAYELTAKMLVKMYAEVKAGRVKRRVPKEE